MKKLLISGLLCSTFLACHPTDSVQRFQALCSDGNQDAAVVCPALAATSIDQNTISKSNGGKFILTLNRPLMYVQYGTNGWQEGSLGPVVQDQVTHVAFKQPDRGIEVDIPKDQLTLAWGYIYGWNSEGLNNLQIHYSPTMNANQLATIVLPADLISLVPGVSTIVEVQVTDWQGIVRTSSVPITITP